MVHLLRLRAVIESLLLLLVGDLLLDGVLLGAVLVLLLLVAGMLLDSELFDAVLVEGVLSPVKLIVQSCYIYLVQVT